MHGNDAGRVGGDGRHADGVAGFLAIHDSFLRGFGEQHGLRGICECPSDHDRPGCDGCDCWRAHDRCAAARGICGQTTRPVSTQAKTGLGRDGRRLPRRAPDDEATVCREDHPPRPKARDPRMLARFEREVRATAKLSHWNSIDIYDYGRTADGTFYYVMEFLPGHNIGEIVEEYGPVPAGRTVYLMDQVFARAQRSPRHWARASRHQAGEHLLCLSRRRVRLTRRPFRRASRLSLQA